MLSTKGEATSNTLPAESVAEEIIARRLEATTDFSRVNEVDAIVICVPTPLNKNREPDSHTFWRQGARSLPTSKGALVVLESTTYPGTTDEDLRAVLETGSGLEAGKDFHLAFSPEREDPANPDSKVGEVPKLVGGLTPACLEKAVQLYGQAIKTVVPVSNLPRRGSRQAPGEYIPQCKHRARK